MSEDPNSDETTEEPDTAHPTMKVICSDGLTLDCGGYKAVDNGIVVTEDEDRDRVIAFVPYYKLEYVLPIDMAEQRLSRPDEAATEQPTTQYQQMTTQPPDQQPIPQQTYPSTQRQPPRQ